MLLPLLSVPAQAGSQIAFSCGDAVGNQQVCVMELSSGFVRLLTFGENHALASWSPDGRMLTYTRLIDDNHTAVGVMDADGAGQRDVADYGLNSTWSITDKIAYVKTAGNGPCGKSIWVVNSDGSGDQQVTCAGLNHDHVSPAWSPDGSQLAYIESSPAWGEAAGLTLAAWVVDGIGAHQVTWPGSVNVDEGGNAINAADSANALNWSPATNRIVFWSGVPLPPAGPFGQVWTMNPDGSDRRQLTHEASWNHDDPSWSPDGNYILFTRGIPDTKNCGCIQLWVMGADGNDPVPLAPMRTGPLAGHSSWQPSGTPAAISPNRETWGGDGAGSSAGDGGGGTGGGGTGDGGD